jgi:hypothetical protein
MTTPKAPGMLTAVLDQLLAGADPRTVFLPNGLLGACCGISAGQR